MRGFVILCAICAVVWVGLIGFALSAETVAAESPWTLDVPVELVAGPVCASPAACAVCPVSRSARFVRSARSVQMRSGQPLRNVGRIALAPLRRLAAAQPLRRVGRAVAKLAPGRRLARLAAAPFRALRR